MRTPPCRFDFEDKTINDEKIAFLAHECFAGSEITTSSFRLDLKNRSGIVKVPGGENAIAVLDK